MDIEIIPLMSFVTITTFTPGPNNISSASMGVMYGYRKSLSYLVGIASGFFVVMIACAGFSSLLLATMPMAEGYLRWTGAGYILWLARAMLYSNLSASKPNVVPKAFSMGFILQLFNPKVAVFGLTLYSTFLAPLAGRLDYLAYSAAAFALTAFAAILIWTLFSAVIKNKLQNDATRKRMNTALSILLVYTAVELSGILSWFGWTD